MIANIWSYCDLLQEHITTLSLTFPVYFGKPAMEPDNPYVYFRLENNSPKISDDRAWVNYKQARFDFVFVGGSPSVTDQELYAMLDTFSEAFCLDVGQYLVLGSGFKIFSITEWDQSGVLRNEKQNPLLLATYDLIYQYRYETSQR